MDDLRRAAIDVLRKNERDGYTAPARGLYTHQHLWDTCFIAIGQRHYDAGGAMASLRRLLRAQWRNGMIPHIIFEPGWRYWWDRRIWRSRGIVRKTGVRKPVAVRARSSRSGSSPHADRGPAC